MICTVYRHLSTLKALALRSMPLPLVQCGLHLGLLGRSQQQQEINPFAAGARCREQNVCSGGNYSYTPAFRRRSPANTDAFGPRWRVSRPDSAHPTATSPTVRPARFPRRPWQNEGVTTSRSATKLRCRAWMAWCDTLARSKANPASTSVRSSVGDGPIWAGARTVGKLAGEFAPLRSCRDAAWKLSRDACLQVCRDVDLSTCRAAEAKRCGLVETRTC